MHTRRLSLLPRASDRSGDIADDGNIHTNRFFTSGFFMGKITLWTDVSVDSMWAGRINGAGVERVVRWTVPSIVSISYHDNGTNRGLMGGTTPPSHNSVKVPDYSEF